MSVPVEQVLELKETNELGFLPTFLWRLNISKTCLCVSLNTVDLIHFD